jgi:hypothetical protein
VELDLFRRDGQPLESTDARDFHSHTVALCERREGRSRRGRLPLNAAALLAAQSQDCEPFAALELRAAREPLSVDCTGYPEERRRGTVQNDRGDPGLERSTTAGASLIKSQSRLLRCDWSCSPNALPFGCGGSE